MVHLQTFESPGSLPLVKLICQPLWGYAADKLRSKKRISLFTTFASTAVLMLLAFPTIASGFLPILAITIGVRFDELKSRMNLLN
jgi:hypothetical protein